MSSDGAPEISVVIPVFDQPAELERCLAALQQQSSPHPRFEVVVVDNAPETPVAEVVGRFPFARYGTEPTPGSYAARNRGVDLARGELVAFTDADCRPDRLWLANGARAMRDLEGPGMVAGEVELTYRNAERLTAAELFEMIFGFPQETYIEWGFAATANMFTTRETITRVGGFDASLMSGGDMEWGQRLRDKGLPQAFAADARVLHGARSSMVELCKKSARVAGGLQNVAEQRGEGTHGLARHAFEQLVKMWRIRGSLSDPRLSRATDKLRFALAVWLVELVQTLERYRVHYGGTPRRL